MEMTDAMRRGLHRPAPEQCWCSKGIVSPRCRIHGKAQPPAPASVPLAEKPVESPAIAPKETGEALLIVTIKGQIRGGKNNMGVGKDGSHFAKPKWREWRDGAVRQVREQLPSAWQSIDVPCSMRLEYWAGDRKRRDQPAVIDAIFHVLEKVGVVKDDTLLWITDSTRAYDKENPRAVITIFKHAL